MKNKPWKEWKTRKVSFIAVSLLWLCTAIQGLSGREISDSIIDFIYKGGTWMLGFGILLVVSDKAAEKIVNIISRRGGGCDE